MPSHSNIQTSNSYPKKLKQEDETKANKLRETTSKVIELKGGEKVEEITEKDLEPP